MRRYAYLNEWWKSTSLLSQGSPVWDSTANQECTVFVRSQAGFRLASKISLGYGLFNRPDLHPLLHPAQFFGEFPVTSSRSYFQMQPFAPEGFGCSCRHLSFWGVFGQKRPFFALHASCRGFESLTVYAAGQEKPHASRDSFDNESNFLELRPPMKHAPRHYANENNLHLAASGGLGRV